MKITGFHQNRDFHENVGFAERRASKIPRNVYVYKGFWRRRRGKLDFHGKHENPENPAENTEMLEIHKKHGNHWKSRNPEKRKSGAWETQRKIRGNHRI